MAILGVPCIGVSGCNIPSGLSGGMFLITEPRVDLATPFEELMKGFAPPGSDPLAWSNVALEVRTELVDPDQLSEAIMNELAVAWPHLSVSRHPSPSAEYFLICTLEEVKKGKEPSSYSMSLFLQDALSRSTDNQGQPSGFQVDALGYSTIEFSATSSGITAYMDSVRGARAERPSSSEPRKRALPKPAFVFRGKGIGGGGKGGN